MAKGVWRTIKGRHVYIEEGQSLSDALNNTSWKKKKQEYNKKLDNIEKENLDKEVREAIKSSYIYRDEYKTDEYMKQYREKYGDQSVDDAIKYYDDNYITVKGTAMDSEGLTYNNILKKDEYPEEALEKYSRDMKELYDREKYSYDSLNYNKKANDLKKELDNSKKPKQEYEKINETYKVENSKEADYGEVKPSKADVIRFQMGHGMSKDLIKSYANNNRQNGIQKDEASISDKIRKNRMAKEKSTFGNDIYHLGNEKKGYYVQFQDVTSHQHEDVNKYKHVSPKVKSNTWARVWKDGQIIYNNDRGWKGEREGKYQARANVAKFIEGEKSYSTLVQSYMNAGFSKLQAEALAKYQLRRRK